MAKKECKKDHGELKAGCTECGTCLYCHSVQIPDPMYPFFKCTACDAVNFWD